LTCRLWTDPTTHRQHPTEDAGRCCVRRVPAQPCSEGSGERGRAALIIPKIIPNSLTRSARDEGPHIPKREGSRTYPSQAPVRMRIPLRDDQSQFCSRSVQPPRVPVGRSAIGTYSQSR
jgi:hypothetical protein